MKRLAAICFLLIPLSVAALQFQSDSQQSIFVELFTSEGCSSCPRADNWLSSLKQDKRLFKTIIPAAFHVTYWDRLGWRDRFALQQHTQRQYDHRKYGRLSQVYTPAVLLNGYEYRYWSHYGIISPKPQEVGVVSVTVQRDKVSVVFEPNNGFEAQKLTAHMALLGAGIVSQVKAGENRNKTLTHDFVILDHQQNATNPVEYKWNFKTPTSDIPAPGKALIVWLESQKNKRFIQATGHWL